MMRPTKFILDAIGEHPAKAGQATEPGVCAMCGFTHEIGDPVVPFAPGGSFTDYTNLLAPESKLICGWCAACWRRDITQTYLRSVVTPEGIFPCASNDHIAYWLTNPPASPFMIFLGDQQQQHVVWRTPVNATGEAIVMRFGERLMVIRPLHLRLATEAARRLAEAITERRAAKRGRGRPAACKNPFVRLSRNLDEQRHGILSEEAFETVDEKEALRPHLEALLSATPGEIWALNATLYAKNPNHPDPVRTAN